MLRENSVSLDMDLLKKVNLHVCPLINVHPVCVVENIRAGL